MLAGRRASKGQALAKELGDKLVGSSLLWRSDTDLQRYSAAFHETVSFHLSQYGVR